MTKTKVLFIHIGNSLINKDVDKIIVKNNNLIYNSHSKDDYYFNKEYIEMSKKYYKEFYKINKMILK